MTSDPNRHTHVLIIDETDALAIYKPVTYSDFVDADKDRVRLMVITSKGALSQQDRDRCMFAIELDRPTRNGMVEMLALRLHHQFRVDVVYTKQEDIILRAAHIRRLLGITNNLQREDALLYRDKYLMKKHARQRGFPVPAFERVFSPVDILAFVELNNLPIIVKPTLGSSSASVRVVRTQEELEKYLENEFYDRIDDVGKTMEYAGDLIVESFLDNRRMYHVNGYARKGRIEHVWPFGYIQTNLGFTQGRAYGNVLIPQTDSRWRGLVSAAQRLLDMMPSPEHLIFHLELFEKARGSDSDGSEIDYVLCEIAARRPGGSIALLMDMAEGGGGFFPETEFRLNIGLPRRERPEIKPLPPSRTVGDLMIPKKPGRLLAVPDPAACPVPGIKCHVFGKIGSVHRCFQLTRLNTCTRLVTEDVFESTEHVERALAEAHAWVDQNTKYEPADCTELDVALSAHHSAKTSRMSSAVVVVDGE
ncbi:hypothetical protein HK105_208299 [Polyrhizophydium stewartii]|uniref:ATP-grasp domain-containing protein n=1 Tax=Polyrhizophydium stewartii TaxID=2732419 RepID=A0ABR4MY90_9FUNG|nr:hypothetical protein HK105_003193 [Polyrhizophydium stewartii]